jgi:hypothetical protein
LVRCCRYGDVMVYLLRALTSTRGAIRQAARSIAGNQSTTMTAATMPLIATTNQTTTMEMEMEGYKQERRRAGKSGTNQHAAIVVLGPKTQRCFIPLSLSLPSIPFPPLLHHTHTHTRAHTHQPHPTFPSLSSIALRATLSPPSTPVAVRVVELCCYCCVLLHHVVFATSIVYESLCPGFAQGHSIAAPSFNS